MRSGRARRNRAGLALGISATVPYRRRGISEHRRPVELATSPPRMGCVYLFIAQNLALARSVLHDRHAHKQCYLDGYALVSLAAVGPDWILRHFHRRTFRAYTDQAIEARALDHLVHRDEPSPVGGLLALDAGQSKSSMESNGAVRGSCRS